MDKGGHCDVEMTGWMQKGGIIRCKLKGRMDKGGNYDVEMTGWMQKGGIIRCKLKGRMDKEVHYEEIKGWMEKVAL